MGEISPFLVIIMAWLVIAWGAVHGVLMCVSPRRFYRFLKWYMSFGGPMVQQVPPGFQIPLRITGFVIFLGSIFFAYQLAKAMLHSLR